MIKTVSFMPPRASKSANARVASSAVPAKSSPANAAAAKNRPAKTPATLDVSEVRAALQKSATGAKKTRVAKNSPAQTTEEKSALAPAEAILVAKVDDVKARKSVENAATKTRATAAKIGDEKDKPVAKRSRVPKDLAAQYGGAPATEEAPRVIEAPAPRKRLTRAKKEARSQLLRADDEVLQRLQQANLIEAQKPARRGRGWEFECGCCGRTTRFATPAALCECGAIAVRE